MSHTVLRYMLCKRVYSHAHHAARSSRFIRYVRFRIRRSVLSSLVLSHTVPVRRWFSPAHAAHVQYFSLYFEVHVLANATPYQVQLYLYLVCDMHTGHVALAVMGEYCTLIVYYGGIQNHLYSIARAISRSATFRITEPPLSLVLFAEYRCKPAGRCSGALSGDPAPPGQLFPAG